MFISHYHHHRRRRRRRLYYPHHSAWHLVLSLFMQEYLFFDQNERSKKTTNYSSSIESAITM